MFHLLSYFVSAGVAATDTDSVAAADPPFSRRGGTGGVGHYVFSDQYSILGAAHLAVSATRARLDSPSLNAYGRHHIWPVERSATVPDIPGWQDLRSYPIRLPIEEEIGVNVSNDLGAGTEATTTYLWIGPPSWNMNLPRGEVDLVVRFTGAVAGVADQWSGLGAITLAENLRSGIWAVLGVQIFDAGVRAFRFQFLKSFDEHGRQLRPGGLGQEAIGNTPMQALMGGFGEWGRFDSFELPQLEIWANATGASVQEGRMWLAKVGDGRL